VVAAIAQKEGFDLYFLFVHYGQRSVRKELRCARKLARHFRAREMRSTRVPWLQQVDGVPLTHDGPLLTAERPEQIYVPFRNSILLSLAVAWAESIEASAVFIGSIGPPWATPDNSPEYFQAFEQLVRIGAKRGEDIHIRAPLCLSRKAEVVRMAEDLAIPLKHTWSCQNFEDAACGLCTSCTDRLAAFGELALADPIVYRPGST
jgi:7-cyano-7-deazaguanine synthase